MTSTLVDAEQLARLYRMSRAEELAPATRQAIKERLLSQLGAEPARVAPPAAKDLPRSVERPAATARPAATGEQLELKLRQLAQNDAPWTEMVEAAMALVGIRRDPATRARMTELAFLHGKAQEVQELVEQFFRSDEGEFYRHIHPAIRAHLVVRLWRAGAAQGVLELLFADRDETYLCGVERLFVLSSMARGAKEPAFAYYHRHAASVLEASRDVGDQVGVAPPALLLEVGRLALDLGRENEARTLFEQIPEDAAERDEALRLLLVVRGQAGRASEHVALLVSSSTPEERLRLMSTFCESTRALGGFKDRNRAAFNEVLKDPLAWLASEPEHWAALSELLCRNRDLAPLLPNILEVFRANALRFHSPVLDAALWQGALTAHYEGVRERYWRGVGMLHHYVNSGVESALWEAREIVEEARREGRDAVPFAWRELHKAAYAWVAKNHYLMEADRTRMLRELRVAVEPANVATVDVEEYLSASSNPPRVVLEGLERVAQAKSLPALESKILLARAASSHLTNADLSRLWRLANERRDGDLAWRVATVLMSRKALVGSVRHAWEISGEKRTHYPFATIDRQAIDLCLKGLAPDAARLAHAVLIVGGALPELLAILDAGSSSARLKAPPADSVEAKVERALAGLVWLPTPKRRFRFSFESAANGAAMPAFVQVMTANVWGLLVGKLADRLGLTAWGWKLSRLHGEIVDLIPRIASRQDLRRHSTRVAQWLKDLAPEQRSAWQDLASVARSMSDAEAVEVMGTVVARLATVLLPHHFLALTSLHAMRASASIVWDLERFILSDGYSELRRRSGTRARVPVPDALARLNEIHGAIDPA